MVSGPGEGEELGRLLDKQLKRVEFVVYCDGVQLRLIGYALYFYIPKNKPHLSVCTGNEVVSGASGGPGRWLCAVPSWLRMVDTAHDRQKGSLCLT